jgi:hypothetical protein
VRLGAPPLRLRQLLAVHVQLRMPGQRRSCAARLWRDRRRRIGSAEALLRRMLLAGGRLGLALQRSDDGCAAGGA